MGKYKNKHNNYFNPVMDSLYALISAPHHLKELHHYIHWGGRIQVYSSCDWPKIVRKRNEVYFRSVLLGLFFLLQVFFFKILWYLHI